MISGNEDPIAMFYSVTAAKVDKLTKLMHAFLWKLFCPFFYLPNVWSCVHGYFYDEHFKNDSFHLSTPMWWVLIDDQFRLHSNPLPIISRACWIRRYVIRTVPKGGAIVPHGTEVDNGQLVNSIRTTLSPQERSAAGLKLNCFSFFIQGSRPIGLFQSAMYSQNVQKLLLRWAVAMLLFVKWFSLWDVVCWSNALFPAYVYHLILSMKPSRAARRMPLEWMC